MAKPVNTLTPFQDNIDTNVKGNYKQKKAFAGPLIRWWLFVLFICLYLILLLPTAEYPVLTIVTLLPTSLALWFGLLPLIGNDGSRKLYDPITLFNAGMFYYSVKGVGLGWGDQTKFLSHIDMEQVAGIYPLVALLTALGIIAWNLGYHASSRRQHAKDQGKGKEKPAGGWRYSYLNPRLGVFFLILVGTLSFYFLIQATGKGPLVFLMDSWRRGFMSDTVLSGSTSAFSSLFVLGMIFLPLAAILWLAILGNNQQRPGVVFWVYTSLALFALFLVMPRATLLSSLLSLMFVYHFAVRRMSVTYLVAFGVVGSLYAYAMGLWRGVTSATSDINQAGSLLLERFTIADLPDFFVSASLSDIRIFVLIVYHYGRDLPLRYGETLLRVITIYVPRGFWPTKPLDLGIELGRLSNPYTYSGVPSGFLPEMYMNFHVVGVLVGTFLLGVLLHRLYSQLLLSHRPHPLSIVVYAITIPRILLLPSNTISNALMAWAIPIGAALLAMWLCTIDKTSEQRPLRNHPENY